MASRPDPSPELRAAQERLLQLRATLGIAPQRAAAPATADPPAHRVGEALRWAQRTLLQRRREDAGLAPEPSPEIGKPSPEGIPPGRSPSPTQSPTAQTPTIIAHPTLVLAMLNAQQETAGRVYFLLRHLDQKGQGWVEVARARAALTERQSPLRICGWRRLRQLLAQGEGIFWQRNNHRLWLQGQHKIGFKLDSGPMHGIPVELPIAALLSGIQATRAAFYACFHGGRGAQPISRETLRDVTGVPERTQRAYDQLAGVARRQNIAIGAPYASSETEERAWRQGRAVFHFIDTQGRQGRENQTYLAWHLPNSYTAAYQRRSKGCRKRLNRKLAGLLNKGTTGNDGMVVERVFFANGALAARQHLREPARDAYWHQPPRARRGQAFWRVMSSAIA